MKTARPYVSGRYLGAIILVVAGRLLDQVQGLYVLRFLSVFQLSFCGLLLFNFLCKNFLRPRESFFIAAIIFTLPPFQIIACQESMFLSRIDPDDDMIDFFLAASEAARRIGTRYAILATILFLVI